MATMVRTETPSYYGRLTALAQRALSLDLLLLIQRFGIAAVFFQSGRTKVEGLFTIPQTTVDLFELEYALPLLPPKLAAYLAAGAEHLFPVLLVLGLFSRLSATALLGMTMVILIGGIDLSVGSVVGVTGILFGLALQQVPIPVAILLAVLAGAGIGLVRADRGQRRPRRRRQRGPAILLRMQYRVYRLAHVAAWRARP